MDCVVGIFFVLRELSRFVRHEELFQNTYRMYVYVWWFFGGRLYEFYLEFLCGWRINMENFAFGATEFAFSVE